MQATSAAVLISIALVLFGICYYFFTTRHKERMALIENGLPPEHFKAQGHFRKFLLVLGVLCTGSALGILSGLLITPYVAYPDIYVLSFTLFLSTGISLIVSYFILEKLQSSR